MALPQEPLAAVQRELAAWPACPPEVSAALLHVCARVPCLAPAWGAPHTAFLRQLAASDMRLALVALEYLGQDEGWRGEGDRCGWCLGAVGLLAGCALLCHACMYARHLCNGRACWQANRPLVLLLLAPCRWPCLP